MNLATLATQNSTYNPVVFVSLRRCEDQNIFFQQGVLNDLVGGTTAASLETLIQASASAARATGYKFVCPTILPSNALSAGQQTEWANYIHGSEPIGLLRQMGWLIFKGMRPWDRLQPLLNTSLYGDGTHPTTLGYSILAPILPQ